MNKPQTVAAVSMAWYREEDYDQLKAMFVDGDKLPDTFVRWQNNAEQGAEKLASEGKAVIKVYIDPVTFPKWCAVNGHRVDAAGRIEFALAEARRMLMKM